MGETPTSPFCLFFLSIFLSGKKEPFFGENSDLARKNSFKVCAVYGSDAPCCIKFAFPDEVKFVEIVTNSFRQSAKTLFKNRIF